MVDSLIQPFRRNLNVPPVIIPVGVNPTPVVVPAMTAEGITSFIMNNCTPCWVWYAGWKGNAGDMPNIKENGHYIAPGATYVGRTQMPQWIAAVVDDEPAFPAFDSNGGYLHAGKRMRMVMIYGSGN